MAIASERDLRAAIPLSAPEPEREQRVLWLFGAAPPHTLQRELGAHAELCDRDASVWPARRMSALLEYTGTGDMQALKGRRVAVVQRDAGAADALAEALRARGATVVVLGLDEGGLSRVEALDPEVFVMHPGELNATNHQVLESIWAHTWLRWTPVLLVARDCLGPIASYAPDVRDLARSVHHLTADFELLLRRARRNEAFSWRLDQLGPVRTLRALIESEHTLRVEFVTAAGSFEVDLGEGLLIGARATLNGAELAGVDALAALLAQERGTIHARPVSYPAYTNVMTPLEAVLLSERSVPQWSLSTPGQERKSVTQVRAVVLPAQAEELHAGAEATGPRKVVRDSSARRELAGEKPARQESRPTRGDARPAPPPSTLRMHSARPSAAPAVNALRGGTLVGQPAPKLPLPSDPPTIQRPLVTASEISPGPTEVAPRVQHPPFSQGAVREPVVEHALEPAVEGAAEPVVEHAHEPAVEHAEEPVEARALAVQWSSHARALASAMWQRFSGLPKRARVVVLSSMVLFTLAALGGVLSLGSRSDAMPSPKLSASPTSGEARDTGARGPKPQDGSQDRVPTPSDRALGAEAPRTGDALGGEKQAGALVGQGHAHRRRHRLEQALLAYQQALALYPGYPRALAGMAEVYLAKKDVTHALELAKTLVQKRPKFADDQRLLGDVYRLAGKKSEAITAYQHAMRLGSRTARQRLKEMH